LLEEPLAPLADHIPPEVEPFRNLLVLEPAGGEEYHLRSHNLKIWQRVFAGSCLEDSLLLVAELDCKWALARHLPLPSGEGIASPTACLKYVAIFTRMGT
jgi:hypothetical protein